MTDYRQRLALEELVTEAYLSASKPVPSLPIDEEDVDMDLSSDEDELFPAPHAEPYSDEDEELEDDEDDSSIEVNVHHVMSLPEISCEEKCHAKKNFMVICDNIHKLKELAEGQDFLEIFEPWMLEKIAVVADTLTTVTNSAKFNSLDAGE